jgi:phosphoribosylglycinamide formyltransferase-1
MTDLRVTVLISGNGSNLQALIDACDRGRLGIEIVQVISNRADAMGLKRAERAGIPTLVIKHQDFPDRASFDTQLAAAILAMQPGLVVLAGFMRIIGPAVLNPFEGRMINLHPSLLPKFRGTNTYQRALDAGDAEHGASIHFVSEELDGGPVLSQLRIPVMNNDDRYTLAARLAPMEHRLLVSTVEFLTRHAVECRDDKIFVDGKPIARPLLLQSDDTLS